MEYYRGCRARGESGSGQGQELRKAGSVLGGMGVVGCRLQQAPVALKRGFPGGSRGRLLRSG